MAGEELDGALPALRRAADTSGGAAVVLDRPLTPERFVATAAALGEPIEEHAPAVQPFVEDRFILNLVTRWDATQDVHKQPFSASPILLHTEGSQRPVRSQPRYLLFQCIDAGPPDGGGQTVVVSMADVFAQLSPEVVEVLQRVQYRAEGMPPILRFVDGVPVFSFRDFGADPIEWSSDVPISEACVDQALDALTEALYQQPSLVAVTWLPNLMLLIDNHRVFHGRSATRRSGGRSRRIQRIRLLAS